MQWRRLKMANPTRLPPISPEAHFTPSDFREILLHLPEGCPLVGGQAVAWWAERYEIKPVVEGKKIPVTSQDIDFWGSREDLKRLAAKMKRRSIFPHEHEMTLWVGAIPLVIQGKQTLAEFLHAIPGLDTNNPDHACVEQMLEGSGKRIQVLSPVSLVFAKLHALRHFDQKNRQDKLHLKVCIEACWHFVSELVRSREVRMALANIKRLVSCHQMSTTRKLEHRCRFNILKGVPIDLLQAAAQSGEQTPENRARLSKFCSDYWPWVLAKDTSAQQPNKTGS
jgi:hypothetical protein